MKRNEIRMSYGEKFLVGQNILLTILTITAFCLSYLLPFYKDRWFPGAATITVFLMSIALSAGTIITYDESSKAHIPFRFIVNSCHLIVVMALYTVSVQEHSRIQPIFGFVGVLFFLLLTFLMIGFSKVYADSNSERGLPLAIISLLFGIAAYTIVVIVTSVF